MSRIIFISHLGSSLLRRELFQKNFGTHARCFHRSRVCLGLSRTGFDDYERERASWSVKIPEKFNFAANVLDVWAQKEKTGERTTSIPAFWFVYENGKEVKWSFQDLERETKRTATMLQNCCGVKHGDSVMVMLPKLPEFWLINIAAMRIDYHSDMKPNGSTIRFKGCVLSPATTQLTAKDLAYRLSKLKPSCFITHENYAGVLEEAAGLNSFPKTKLLVFDEMNKTRKDWLNFNSLLKNANSNHKCADTNSDDTMMVFFTSGTTGYPKMVEHSHSSYGIGHESTGKYLLDLTKENIMWNLSDTGWAKTAYSSIFAPWSQGSCVFIHQMPRFNLKQTLEVLSKYPIDTFCGPPLAYRMMVQQDLKSYNLSKLTHYFSGGEPVDTQVNKDWELATGHHIQVGYGQTETIILTGMFKCLKFKNGSMGKPVPGLDIVIIDENENEVGPGVEGEVAIKRKNDKIFGLFKGYRDDPELTKKRLGGKYFHTGDLAYYDEEGYFYFVARKDDIINSAGYRIGPTEVENALLEHPAVNEVAVISSPDEIRGEVVKALIVLKDAYPIESKSDLIKEIQEHAKQTTAPYKYPRKIEFLKELPKTPSGKIKKFELREKEWNKK